MWRRAPALIVAILAVVVASLPGTTLAVGQPANPGGPPHSGAVARPQAGSPSGASRSPGDPVTGGGPSAAGAAAATVQPLCAAPGRPHYASCFALRRTDAAPRRGAAPALAPGGYGPGDLRDAYKLPQGVGAGSVVAIVDAFDDPNAEADLNTYRAQYGLGACTSAGGCFRKIDQRGGTRYPAADSGWAGEISLDLDMVSAICPLCQILLVEANDNGNANLAASVDEAVAQGARFVSNSYGAYADDPSVAAFAGDYDHPGAVITASSGDSGYGVSSPASYSHVTAVGGTSLVRAAESARGWSESAWSGAGSGCSTFLTKPAWQTDAGCPHRTVADVSAVADPNTGVAVYDTFQQTGWGVFGGTSVSAPIIASIYALAGIPRGGSYPASFPYGQPSALFDATGGSNGSCTPAYLCTGGPGYDGPTGLGTPDGIAAFASGPHGTIAGTVTNAATGAPLAGAEVEVAASPGATAALHTDAQGRYSVSVPTGGYTVTAVVFGYGDRSSTVQVSDGGTSTADLPLRTVPFHTVSGRVTDGSGHGWPLFAQVSVPGQPASTYSDPASGRYSLRLPVNHPWRLEVASQYYPGYPGATATVAAGGGSVHHDFALPIDRSTGNSTIEAYQAGGCTSPGYAFTYAGTTQRFDSAAGWKVVDAAGAGNAWTFANSPVPNFTSDYRGTTDPYAAVNLFTIHNTPDHKVDTSLVSPPLDLTGDPSPVVEFDTEYSFVYWGGGAYMWAYVDVSTGGGSSWTTALDIPPRYYVDTGHLVVPIPQAAGRKGVQVRFRYAGVTSRFSSFKPDTFVGWQLDNVFVGDKSCRLVPGGLVTGRVLDRNTGAGVDQAQVSVAGSQVVSAPGPAGSGLGDGAYYAFTPAGRRQVTASVGAYGTRTVSADVDPNAVANVRVSLPAGRVEADPTSIHVTQAAGEKETAGFTVRNTGSRPATFSIDPRAGAGPGAAAGAGAVAAAAPTLAAASSPSPGSTWQPQTSFPQWVQDSLAATDPDTGLVYSIGGIGEFLDSVSFAGGERVFDPASGTWRAIAPMPQGIELDRLSGGFVDGKLYVLGESAVDLSHWLLVYDPRTDTWTRGPDAPLDRAFAGSATVDGKLYFVGGCESWQCYHNDVQVYDPRTGHWSIAASYPENVYRAACGAIAGKVYCAGGVTMSPDLTVGALKDAFAYDPQADRWTPVASLPTSLYGMAYTAANGRLLLSGGIAGGLGASTGTTDQGYAYDPLTNAWTALPANGQPGAFAAGACGFYKIGGTKFRGVGYGGAKFYLNTDTVQRLPGWSECNGDAPVSWLSVPGTKVMLRPGESRRVRVTLDTHGVTQPGVLSATLVIHQDTPYDFGYVPVTLDVRAGR